LGAKSDEVVWLYRLSFQKHAEAYFTTQYNLQDVRKYVRFMNFRATLSKQNLNNFTHKNNKNKIQNYIYFLLKFT